jgi:hypothetical protein
LASSWLGRDNRRERKHRCSRTAAGRSNRLGHVAEEALAAARSRDNPRHVSVRYNLWSNYNALRNPFRTI